MGCLNRFVPSKSPKCDKTLTRSYLKDDNTKGEFQSRVIFFGIWRRTEQKQQFEQRKKIKKWGDTISNFKVFPSDSSLHDMFIYSPLFIVSVFVSFLIILVILVYIFIQVIKIHLFFLYYVLSFYDLISFFLNFCSLFNRICLDS